MYDQTFIGFSRPVGQELLSLVDTVIVVDQADLPAVHIAAHNLARDFARVTRGAASPVQTVRAERDDFAIAGDTAIIVGSIEASPLLQRLEKDGKLDFSQIRGKSYTTAIVDMPFNGCCQALVIAGSDKRGAVFGIYSLSEQIGVSPYSPLIYRCRAHRRLTLKQMVLVG